MTDAKTVHHEEGNSSSHRTRILPSYSWIRRVHHASNRYNRRRAWGEVGADGGATSRSSMWRETNPIPWGTEGEGGKAAEVGGEHNTRAHRSMTSQKEGIVSLAGAEDAKTVRLVEGNISSLHTRTLPSDSWTH